MTYSVPAHGGYDRFADRAHETPVFQKFGLVYIGVCNNGQLEIQGENRGEVQKKRTFFVFHFLDIGAS